jgi:protein-S-isoprenylcysteine O-methyltransferase Ste14
MCLDVVEVWIGRIGGLAAAVTLAAALRGLQAASRRPSGRQEGAARQVLRWPLQWLATLAFVGLGIVLWRPLPWQPSAVARVAALMAGALLFFGGMALYVWGMRTLGQEFDGASGFGVRLRAGHRLITHGPYAVVRHPMYVAVICVFLGALLLYRTWAMAIYGVMMLGLVARGRREERVLAGEYGDKWRAYCRRVPGWLPRLRRRA